MISTPSLKTGSALIHNKNSPEIAVYSRWAHYVGTGVASHSTPVEIQNHTIVIEVDHPAWLQKLHMESVAIIKNINKKNPTLAIKGVQFYLRNR